MHARKFLAGLGASAAALSVLALTAAPANAAYTVDPDDTAVHPGATTDLIGVGSDTTQGVVKVVADAFNNQGTPPAAKIVSYAATGGGTLDLPDASSINRPVGSGAGKTLLYNPSNPNIDFARSSSAQNTAETNAGLQSFPFAVDTLIMVKSGNVASHAPASLTIAQILSIYKKDVTDWSQVGGSAGTIKPLLPQSGSGTLSFFTAQLTAANGGVAPNLTGLTSVTEHDPNPIKDDPDAIAPFSLAKKSTLANPAVVTTEPGFKADRAVYNVVRGADVAKPEVLAAFGSNGYFCSAAAKSLIEAQGFRQLYSPSKGGVCGQPTQNPTTNLTSADVATTTTVTVTSASASSARITAAVSGSTAPSGTVAFYEGATLLQSGVPLTSGQAVRVQTTTPGVHTYRAVFTPAANTPFLTSEGTGTGTVQKATSSISVAFPKTVKFGKKAKGDVTVTLTGTSSKAGGTVTITEGKKVLGTGTLVNGKVTITLKKPLKPGKHTLTVTWAGDANAAGSEATFKIKALAKPKKK